MIVESRASRITWSTVKYVFALVVLLCTVAPFAWLFISSVLPTQDLYSVPLKLAPSDFSWSRYVAIFSNTDPNSPAYVFRRAMGNSIEIAVVVTMVCLVLGFFSAYAFARLNFRWKRSLMFFFLFTYMVPSISLVMPMYVLFSQTHMLNSKGTLMLVYSSFVLPYTVWVLQGYLGGIPKELEEAARVDGCTHFGAIVRVIIPVAIPAIVATAVFALMLAWDEFLYALILTSTVDAQTISVAIASFVGKNVADFGMIATGGVLAALPPTLFALLFQRYIVGGLTAGSVKG
jgi:multiple sugar transport system permease protein